MDFIWFVEHTAYTIRINPCILLDITKTPSVWVKKAKDDYLQVMYEKSDTSIFLPTPYHFWQTFHLPVFSLPNWTPFSSALFSPLSLLAVSPSAFPLSRPLSIDPSIQNPNSMPWAIYHLLFWALLVRCEGTRKLQANSSNIQLLRRDNEMG